MWAMVAIKKYYHDISDSLQVTPHNWASEPE